MTGREKLEKIIKDLDSGQQLDRTNQDIEWIWEKSKSYPQNSSIADKGWEILSGKLNQSGDFVLKNQKEEVKEIIIYPDSQKITGKLVKPDFHIFRKAIAIAASIVLIVSTGVWFWNNHFQNEAVNYLIQTETKQISKEELPDGSVVQLNAGSTLIYSNEFGKKNRNINFEGEAYFQVAGNKKLPFIISTGNSKIKVIGTSFNIDGQISGFKKISVVEGLVEVSLNNEVIGQFKKEQEVIIDEVNQSYTIGNVTNAIRWDDNTFQFENTKLSHVIEKLEKWYGVSFNYPAELANERVTTTFDKKSPEKSAEILSMTLHEEITVIK